MLLLTSTMIKSSENETYDCIHISKHHTINNTIYRVIVIISLSSLTIIIANCKRGAVLSYKRPICDSRRLYRQIFFAKSIEITTLHECQFSLCMPLPPYNLTTSMMMTTSTLQLLIILSLTATITVAATTPYHTLTSSDLPLPNKTAAQPSPLKGFVTSPEWHTGGYTNPQYNEVDGIESTMEFYYIGLSDVMTGMDNFTLFDTVVEPRLVASNKC